MQISADEQLPSLPEVPLRALEACRQEASYRRISDIISADTGLVARVLALASSPLFGPQPGVGSIDQALLRLGTERLHTLVLTAALHQLLLELGSGHWQALQTFWRQALMAALSARAIALLTRYPAPDEAFMLGMIHKAGALYLLRVSVESPLRDDVQEPDPAAISAQLAAAWGLGEKAADALRTQNQAPHDLAGHSHLAKLTAMATALADSEARGMMAGATLFGLNDDLTAEISRRIQREVVELAESLGISLGPDYDGAVATRKLTVAAVREVLEQQIQPGQGGVSKENLRRQVHEINNPLTIVRQYIYQLRSRLDDPRSLNDLDVIREELERAGELLSRLVSEQDSGLPAGTGAEAVNLNAELRALDAVLQGGLFAGASAQCELDLCAENTDLACPAAPLRQVVINLLRNAAESRDGEVRIRVGSAAPVWQQRQQWVELSIEDNGPGLPRAVQEHLFEPVDSSKGEGHSGLGLSIVKQLVDDMEGIISCQSSATGTRFRILLPARPVPDEAVTFTMDNAP